MNIADTIATVWGNVWPYLVAILLFGVIIAIHEFGHFFFAKLFKVKVNEFALGMGPAIFKKKIGETQYALRLLPIGGFVSMEGEDSESDDEGAFNKKKPYQRFIIVAAGAILNLILGKHFTLSNFLLSLIGWDSIGNSSWYIFAIFSFYIIFIISFSIMKNKSLKDILPCLKRRFASSLAQFTAAGIKPPTLIASLQISIQGKFS